MTQKGMSARQQTRWEARQRLTLRPENSGDPLSPRVLRRECVTRNPVIDFPYHLFVAGEVNREEWAKIVRDELLPITRGKKATLARLLGMDPKTIDLWLQARVTVSHASVVQAAEKTNRNPNEWLGRVGFYAPDEAPAPLTNEQIDEEQRTVLDLDIDDEQKALILEALDEMRTTDERLLDEQRARDKQRRQQRIAEMIERARERRTA